jgi:AraC-like DNA-binding protein
MHARLKLATSGENIMNVALSVGYQSHTQFSREYARQFGLSPSADLKKISLSHTRN